MDGGTQQGQTSETVDFLFRCNHCVKLIPEAAPIYMRNDSSYCSTVCRKNGISPDYTNLVGHQLKLMQTKETEHQPFARSLSADSSLVEGSEAEPSDEQQGAQSLPFRLVAKLGQKILDKIIPVVKDNPAGDRLLRTYSSGLVWGKEYTRNSSFNFLFQYFPNLDAYYPEDFANEAAALERAGGPDGGPVVRRRSSGSIIASTTGIMGTGVGVKLKNKNDHAGANQSQTGGAVVSSETTASTAVPAPPLGGETTDEDGFLLSEGPTSAVDNKGSAIFTSSLGGLVPTGASPPPQELQPPVPREATSADYPPIQQVRVGTSAATGSSSSPKNMLAGAPGSPSSIGPGSGTGSTSPPAATAQPGATRAVTSTQHEHQPSNKKTRFMDEVAPVVETVVYSQAEAQSARIAFIEDTSASTTPPNPDDPALLSGSSSKPGSPGTVVRYPGGGVATAVSTSTSTSGGGPAEGRVGTMGGTMPPSLVPPGASASSSTSTSTGGRKLNAIAEEPSPKILTDTEKAVNREGAKIIGVTPDQEERLDSNRAGASMGQK